MSELLLAAFGALGPAPSRRELGLVADAVRDCRDREVLSLWDGPHYGPGWERLVEIAEEADAGYYVALDLYAEVSNPGSVSQYGGAEELRRRVRDAEGAARGLGPVRVAPPATASASRLGR